MDVIIAETDAYMMHFTTPTKELRTEYFEAQQNDSLRCDRVSDNCLLKPSFVERLRESIPYIMPSYWVPRGGQ